MLEGPIFSGASPPDRPPPWSPSRTRCGAYSTSRPAPAFYNIRKLNLCSKTDISKTAWINVWTGMKTLILIITPAKTYFDTSKLAIYQMKNTKRGIISF